MMRFLTLFCSFLFGSLCQQICADITLPKLFSDHMVLQQSDEIKIWGKADAEEELEVSLGQSQAKVTAGTDGQWAVKLPRPTGYGPFELTIAGESSKVVLTNVLLGEVWLCTGQGHMNLTLPNSVDGKKELEKIANANLRFFKVPKHSIDNPIADIEKKASWEVCGSKSAEAFSAVAYYFGKKLQSELKCPVGLILAAVDKAPAEAWIKRKDLDEASVFKELLEHWDARGKDIISESRPSNLFNGMIAPLVDFKIRGVVCYLGESNVGRGHQFATLFPTLIKNWRAAFGGSEFPFYYVALAPHRYENMDAEDLPEIWDAQLKTLRLNNTGMVVASDITDPESSKIINAKPIADRLSAWAFAKDYAKKDKVFSGPIFQKAEIDGNQIRLRFAHVGTGLMVKGGGQLTDFTVAGSDKKFIKANAEIDGDSVVVSCDKIDRPVAVRFGWTDTAMPNLFNNAGLPAAPFRTDAFELKSVNKHYR
jgi:sialate O-acetylesterase